VNQPADLYIAAEQRCASELVVSEFQQLIVLEDQMDVTFPDEYFLDRA